MLNKQKILPRGKEMLVKLWHNFKDALPRQTLQQLCDYAKTQSVKKLHKT